MCGIFGIWDPAGAPVDRTALLRGTSALAHRGPDDEGFLLVNTSTGTARAFAGDATHRGSGFPHLREAGNDHFDLGFGFRRLSILDPSPRGHQPMAGPEERTWIVFNGEIYNYIELRAELEGVGHRFRTGTDTEVILNAYAHWGPSCLERFNGMWALAIWDVDKKELFLARDRFGVKPLHFAERGSSIGFASEMKALLVAGLADLEPDPAAIAGFVALGQLPSHRAGDTFLSGVEQLPASHHLTVSTAGRRLVRYWDVPPAGLGQDAKSAVDRQRQLFADSVRLRLRSDVTVGSCLSGGLDSSSIVAQVAGLMHDEHDITKAQLGDHQQTFSAVYPEGGRWDESEYIDEVVKLTGAKGNTVVPTAERLWDDLERMVWHQEEPFQSTSIFAQWCVMELAKASGVTVLLDGQGADEVLAGYGPLLPYLSGLVRQGSIGPALTAARAARREGMSLPSHIAARLVLSQMPTTVLKPLYARRARKGLAGSALHREFAPYVVEATTLRRDELQSERSLSAHLRHLIFETSLPNLLRFEDRNSMAFSIEARVPFLDYRAVEHAFSGGSHYRIAKGWTKWLQRKAIEDRLPAGVVWRRDKVGFETPERAWMTNPATPWMDLVRSSSKVRDYLDVDLVERNFSASLEPGQDVRRPWRWINLAVWLEVMASKVQEAATEA